MCVYVVVVPRLQRVMDEDLKMFPHLGCNHGLLGTNEVRQDEACLRRRPWRLQSPPRARQEPMVGWLRWRDSDPFRRLLRGNQANTLSGDTGRVSNATSDQGSSRDEAVDQGVHYVQQGPRHLVVPRPTPCNESPVDDGRFFHRENGGSQLYWCTRLQRFQVYPCYCGYTTQPYSPPTSPTWSPTQRIDDEDIKS